MNVNIHVSADEEADITVHVNNRRIRIMHDPDRPSNPVGIYVENNLRERGDPRWVLAGYVDDLSKKVKTAENLALLKLAE